MTQAVRFIGRKVRAWTHPDSTAPVFSRHRGGWYVVGIVHDQWTI